MLILRTLTWSNAFSYGADNTINLAEARVTQLVGGNGRGKSSIPLILQECLFNKNSKGLKKADIPNKYLDSNVYKMSVEFELDGLDYFFGIVRKGATTETELLRDGEEIGSHTATATFKQVESLLGLDFKTFTSLIYQSALSSLEFLTATDTNRKKFLISLLNLGEYTLEEQKIKQVLSEVNLEVAKVSSAIETIEAWLNSNKLVNSDDKELCEIPEDPKNLRNEIAKLEVDKANAGTSNISILANNRNKAEVIRLAKLVPEVEPVSPTEDVSDISARAGEAAANKLSATKMKAKLDALGDKCPTCMSNIDRPLVDSLVKEQVDIIAKQTEISKSLSRSKEAFDAATLNCTNFSKAVQRLEVASAKVVELDELPIEIADLNSKLASLKIELKSKIDAITNATKDNNAATAFNERQKLIKEQSDDFLEKLEIHMNRLDELQEQVTHLEILKRAFSTKGLVAYKIESMVKDLEIMINEYLAELAQGEFNLAFVMQGEKLNVDMLARGVPTSISALSTGELAKVNIATLLAIRKLMHSLSNTKLNVLFLDEVVSALDDQSRERLVEVLLKEENLNAFIVSHGWEHPLVDKIQVIKENNISRVEYE